VYGSTGTLCAYSPAELNQNVCTALARDDAAIITGIEAGRVLITSTRPTFNLLLLLRASV